MLKIHLTIWQSGLGAMHLNWNIEPTKTACGLEHSACAFCMCQGRKDALSDLRGHWTSIGLTPAGPGLQASSGCNGHGTLFVFFQRSAPAQKHMAGPCWLTSRWLTKILLDCFPEGFTAETSCGSQRSDQGSLGFQSHMYRVDGTITARIPLTRGSDVSPGLSLAGQKAKQWSGPISFSSACYSRCCAGDVSLFCTLAAICGSWAAALGTRNYNQSEYPANVRRCREYGSWHDPAWFFLFLFRWFFVRSYPYSCRSAIAQHKFAWQC